MQAGLIVCEFFPNLSASLNVKFILNTDHKS